MLNIGLISQEYPTETAKGGIGTQTYLKARGLTALGHDVRVISRSLVGKRMDTVDDGIRVIRVPSAAVPVYTELADWLSYSQRVAEEIAEQHVREQFDLLDFPEWACEGYVHLLNQCEWNRIPSVVHLHGPLVMLARTLGWPDLDSEFFRTGSQMEATTLRLADGVFSSSACSADWCTREYGLGQARIPVLHTGVDREIFFPRPVPKSAEPTIVFVGKMVRNKGVDVLAEAACRIAGEFPGLQLRLLGGGEESIIEAVRDRAAERGLEGMLDMPGYVDRRGLPDQLSAAHVLAAPSRYEGGPGFVYLEAMACGLPVIGCRGSGAAEVIRHGETGLLVPPDDVSALADALRRLLSDPGEREAIGARALHFVAEEADSRVCVARIADFYQAVITGQASAAGQLGC
jgi:glycosyltransferase involved in cell wall biosynthesis